jgi:HEAT repeats
MMVCRRRWCLVSLIVLAGGASPTIALAAVPDPPHSAADFEKVSGRDLVTFRDENLNAAPKSLQERAEYARKVGAEFTKSGLGVNSKNVAVRLNSAMLIAQLAIVGADRAPIDMLSNDDPAVRFWAAKGLGSIASDALRAGVAGGAIAALDAAAKKEKDGVVAQQIINTLIKYDAPEPISHALQNIASQIQVAIPDAGMLEAAALGLDAIAPKVAGASPALKTQYATTAMRLATYTIQQAKANDASLKAIGLTLPQGYVDASRHVVIAATHVAGPSAGKTYRAPSSGASFDELELDVNTLFGTPPAGSAAAKPGQLQADVKDVPPPDGVKLPAAGGQ